LLILNQLGPIEAQLATNVAIQGSPRWPWMTPGVEFWARGVGLVAQE